MSDLSRRRLLLAAASVGFTAAALSACTERQGVEGVGTADVIVVGAGLSGLCLTRELVGQGRTTRQSGHHRHSR